MARASNVYVVHDNLSAPLGPLVAFTVKHELVSWLQSVTGDVYFFTVWRLGDNNINRAATKLDIADLLAGGKG